jgi:diguanylate cyclase
MSKSLPCMSFDSERAARTELDALQQRATLAVALRRAIETGALHVEYQPQLCSAGSLLGFEGLVRWHPPSGPVSLAEFLPLTDRLGLMTQLTDLVLDQVCRQLVRWRDAGAQAPCVSVNLSAHDLDRSDLAAELLGIVRRHCLSPTDVMFEITETELITWIDSARAQLQLLRDEGVKIAIDDFGTGFSSLAQLVALPVDALKIDRSFLLGVPGEAKREQVVRVIVNLANDLGMQVVAEGVEQPEQLDWLASLGVNAYQGYLFHGPAPAEHWTALLSNDRKRLTGWEVTESARMFLPGAIQ